MKSFHIDSNDAGQRIDKFVTKVTVDLPKGMLYKAFRTKRIKRNGVRCAAADLLAEGDQLELYLNDEFFPSHKRPLDFLEAPASLSILYEDANILLLDKPVGLAAHSDRRADSDTLVNRVRRYLYDKGEYRPEQEHSFAPSLCNRIDRNTQGIVIAAKNAPALRTMNQKIKQHELQKHYLCAVHGVPEPPHALLKAFWRKDAEKNRALISDRPLPGAKEIQTEYTVLRQSKGQSLVEVVLHTGRSHQIRAHMAHIGHPLIGDPKYGGGAGLPRQLLSAYKLVFAFEGDAGVLNNLSGREFVLPDVWFAHDFK